MIPIVDVSQHQGLIDWTRVKGSIQSAVIRMGYRGYHSGAIAIDPRYRYNRQQAAKAGIPYSLYFFPCSINDAEALEEAELIIKECKGMTFPLPIFLDSEVAEAAGRGRADRLDPVTRTHLLKVTIDKCQAAGIPMGVYASTYWLNNNLNMSELPYSVWCAQYASRCRYTGSYMLWQYTSSGQIPGISGGVDLSEPHSIIKQTPASTVNPYGKPSTTIRLGQKGYAVKWLQWELVHKGYQIMVDGIFGHATLSAVKTFQSSAGLQADGIVGKLTRGALTT